MSLLRTLGQRVPAFASLEASLSAPSKRSLESVRGDLWKNRAEYWIRRAQNVSPSFKASKSEATAFWTQKVNNSASWTYGDVASGVVVGTQLAGCFCLGEVLGRGRITGYPQGAAHGH